jgi:hypothetical protein
VSRLPLDQSDRRVVSIALVIVLAFALACLTIGAGVGLGVRAYLAISGVGG